MDAALHSTFSDCRGNYDHGNLEKCVVDVLPKLDIDVRHCGYDPLDCDTMQA